MSATPATSVAVELSVVAEHVDRYRERVSALVQPLLGGDHDDAVAAMFEAERSLRTAQRLLVRATSLLVA